MKARPTMYRGIQMRSRLEADFAQFLDRPAGNGRWTWTYEPRCFAGQSGQYLPDFGVEFTGDSPTIFIEVKPRNFPITQVDPLLRRMMVVWDSEPTTHIELSLWSYGDRDSSALVYRGDDGIWYWHEHDHSWMWPGMGQLEAAHSGALVPAGVN